MAVFFFITHEKGFKFHVQPQTGAYSCLSTVVDHHSEFCTNLFPCREREGISREAEVGIVQGQDNNPPPLYLHRH